MDTFGNQLKQERKRRNVDLNEIARSTKIRVRYLRALEDGQHERLPGIVFAKGYVRAYAETIGADADRLVRAYVEEQRALGRLQTEASQEGVLEALAAAVENDRRSPGRRMFAIGAAVLIGTLALWFGIRLLVDREPAAAATSGETPTLTEQTEPAQAKAVQPEPARTELLAVPVAVAVPVPVPTEPLQIQPVHPRTMPSAVPLVAIAPASTMTISDYGVGSGVDQRDLVGRASTFDAGTRVVFWTRVVGGEPGRELRHVWLHEGRIISGITLSIGGSHWRTYSRKTLRFSGGWTVEAQDESGQVLARQSFLVR